MMMQLLEFNRLIQEVGLNKIANELNQVALPSIRLITKREDGQQAAIGTSKLGGKPDLPKGYIWPTLHGIPLIFLAQIKLSECRAFDTHNLLPKDGWLYFFFNQETYLEQITANKTVKETWRVLYFDGNIADLQRTSLPTMPSDYTPTLNFHYRKSEYSEHTIDFASELTLPDYSSYDPDSLNRVGLFTPLSEIEEAAYDELQFLLAYGRKRSEEDFSAVNPRHQLLGYAAPIQWDVLRDCVRDHNATNNPSEIANIGSTSNWQLLLQLDEDFSTGMRWVSSGRIFFAYLNKI